MMPLMTTRKNQKNCVGSSCRWSPRKAGAANPTVGTLTRLAGETSEAGEFFEPADADTVATIKELIETRVRPAVANDGGDITFRGYKEGVVYLAMKGSCSGCPSSTATLKHGIQNLLRHFVPDVPEVRPI